MTLTVGEGDTGNGGAMTLTAGKTTASGAVGGDVTVTAGQGDTGGDLILDAGQGTSVGVAYTGNVTVGVDNAATILVGRSANDGRVLLSGMVEAFTFKIGRQDHSGLIDKHLRVDTSAFTVPLLYPSSKYGFSVNVPGAALGDIVQVSFSSSIGELYLTAHASAADTVRVTVHNPGHNVEAEQLPEGVFTVVCTGYV